MTPDDISEALEVVTRVVIDAAIEVVKAPSVISEELFDWLIDD